MNNNKQFIAWCIYEAGLGLYCNVVGLKAMLNMVSVLVLSFHLCLMCMSSCMRSRRKESVAKYLRRRILQITSQRNINYSYKLHTCILCCAACNRLFISSSKTLIRLSVLCQHPQRKPNTICLQFLLGG